MCLGEAECTYCSMIQSGLAVIAKMLPIFLVANSLYFKMSN